MLGNSKAQGLRRGWVAVSRPCPSRGCPEEHFHVLAIRSWQDSLAERSKAVAQGAIPKGRGFEPHSCQTASVA